MSDVTKDKVAKAWEKKTGAPHSVVEAEGFAGRTSQGDPDVTQFQVIAEQTNSLAAAGTLDELLEQAGEPFVDDGVPNVKAHSQQGSGNVNPSEPVNDAAAQEAQRKAWEKEQKGRSTSDAPDQQGAGFVAPDAKADASPADAGKAANEAVSKGKSESKSSKSKG